MIYLNLIPKTLWYLNLRSLLTEQRWKKLSLSIREEQDWTCQACGISIKQLKQKKYFHCHEMWDFDDEKQEVKLLCLITLCSHCHMATHFGFSSINNKSQQSIKQIMKVNHWDRQTINYYLEGMFEQWMQRSNKQWKINMDSIKNFLSEDDFKLVENNLKKY